MSMIQAQWWSEGSWDQSLLRVLSGILQFQTIALQKDPFYHLFQGWGWMHWLGEFDRLCSGFRCWWYNPKCRWWAILELVFAVTTLLSTNRLPWRQVYSTAFLACRHEPPSSLKHLPKMVRVRLAWTLWAANEPRYPNSGEEETWPSRIRLKFPSSNERSQAAWWRYRGTWIAISGMHPWVGWTHCWGRV